MYSIVCIYPNSSLLSPGSGPWGGIQLFASSQGWSSAFLCVCSWNTSAPGSLGTLGVEFLGCRARCSFHFSVLGRAWQPPNWSQCKLAGSSGHGSPVQAGPGRAPSHFPGLSRHARCLSSARRPAILRLASNYVMRVSLSHSGLVPFPSALRPSKAL